MHTRVRAGDPVIFRVTKYSMEPGPRARDVHPAPHGETYNYYVDKFWTVRKVLPNGHLELVTRRGKVHDVDPGDPRLRVASWWERLLYRNRFPDLQAIEDVGGGTPRAAAPMAR